MKKIVLICLLLITLTGCLKIYKPDHSGYYLSEYGGIKYSEGNYYLNRAHEYILILKNNKFEEYIKRDNEKIYLVEKNECLYANNYDTNSTQQIGKLDEKDIEFKKYKLDHYNASDDYVECKLYYGDDIILRFNVNNENCLFFDTYMYYIDENLYFTSIKYHQSTYGPNTDMNINGLDFLGSDLYKIDLENKKVDLVYSTDNTQAIAYGNENIIYYLDDKYNIHKFNTNNGSDSIVYDGKGCKEITVSYNHNKLFIFSDVEECAIDVEFNDE